MPRCLKLFKEWLHENKNEVIKVISLIMLVELVLVLLFFLPSSVKEQFILHKDYMNLIDLLGNHFVHENISHLLFNMVGYLLVSIPLFLLVLKFGNVKTFYKLFVLNLTLVPIVVSLVWIPVNRYIWTSIQTTMGFSDINAAFMGSLIVAYALEYLKLKIK